jgi:hypothetical protein
LQHCQQGRGTRIGGVARTQAAQLTQAGIRLAHCKARLSCLHRYRQRIIGAGASLLKLG